MLDTLFFRAIFFLCMFLLPVLPASAHPHAWINVSSTLLFNQKGEAEAIQMRWIFDSFYTEFALPKIDTPLTTQQRIDALTKENLHNLKEFNYFTYIVANNELQSYTAVKNISSALENNRIVINFTVVLKTPISPLKTQISYRIFDPEYYIEMRHKKVKSIQLGKGAPATCVPALIPPSPSIAMLSTASALKKDAAAPSEDFGGLFAETVKIQCTK